MTPEEKARQLDMFMGSDVIDHMRFGTKMDADANVDPAKAAATIGELRLRSDSRPLSNEGRGFQ